MPTCWYRFGIGVAIGLALGSLSAVVVGIFGKFSELGPWNSLARPGWVLAISGPSLLRKGRTALDFAKRFFIILASRKFVDFVDFCKKEKPWLPTRTRDIPYTVGLLVFFPGFPSGPRIALCSIGRGGEWHRAVEGALCFF